MTIETYAMSILQCIPKSPRPTCGLLRIARRAGSQITGTLSTLKPVPSFGGRFHSAQRQARIRPAALLAVASLLLLNAAATPDSAGAAVVPVRASIATGELTPGHSARVTVAISIDEGWHINSPSPRQKFLIATSIQWRLPTGVAVQGVEYPSPITRRLSLAGDRELELFEGDIAVTATLAATADADVSAEAMAVLHYQACNDTVCLRPASIELPLGWGGEEQAAGLFSGNVEALKIAESVAAGPWVVVPLMLGLGLILNLTPCVYPLILVTIAFFGGQAGGKRGRRIWLAILYVLGIAITFSAVGASAALSGSFFGSVIAKPGVQLGLALLMVALALSAFGVYQIRIPTSLAMRIGSTGGGALGALSMGMTMGLVAAPCVGPVVVGLLVYVGSQADVAHGIWLFFLLALGLGLPYVVLAAAAGSISSLPRSGAWLLWTEHLFGCILLAMALYFAGGLLPDNIERWLMAGYLAGAAVFLAFIDKAGSEFRAFLLGRRVAGVAALAVVGVVYLPAGHGSAGLSWQEFSAPTYDSARKSGSPFVLEFGAEWCLPCKEMEERTFTDATVLEAGKGMTFISVDMTTSDRRTELILESFEVFGAPTTIFYGPDGKEWKRKIGFIGPEDFAKLLHEGRKRPSKGSLSGASGA
jgi:thiol:disulfide interchange protein DsbD